MRLEVLYKAGARRRINARRGAAHIELRPVLQLMRRQLQRRKDFAANLVGTRIHLFAAQKEKLLARKVLHPTLDLIDIHAARFVRMTLKLDATIVLIGQHLFCFTWQAAVFELESLFK